MAEPASATIVAITGLISGITGLIVAVTALIRAIRARPGSGNERQQP